MTKYIDAEAFKLKTQVEMTEEKSMKPTDANFHNFLDAIYSLIARGVDEMPTADVVERKKDVVEVVRCRDCVHYKQWYRDRGLCDLWARDGISVFNDGFCNYGEKKEKNDDPR